MEEEYSHSEMAEENRSEATKESSDYSSSSRSSGMVDEHELVPLNKDLSSEPLLDKKGKESKKDLHKWKWKNMAIVASLAMCYLLCNMAFSTISPFYPEEAESKGVSSTVVGLVIGSSQLTVAILSPLFGYMIPKTGFVIPMVFGLWMVGLTYLSLAFLNMVSSAWLFIAISITLRIMEGIGSALFYTSTLAVVPLLFPDHVATLMGLFELVTGFGFCAGFLLGGVLYEVGGFTLPFLTVGAAVLVSSFPCVLLVRKIKTSTEDKDVLPMKVIFSMSKDLVVVALILAIVCSGSCHTYYSPTMELFLMEKFNFTSLHSALAFCIAPSLHVTSSFIIGPIVDRVGHYRYFIATGLVTGGISFIIIECFFSAELVSIYVVVFALVLQGLAVGFGLVPVYTDLVQSSERHLRKGDSHRALTSFVSGLISSSIYLGQFWGALAGGTLRDYFTFAMTSAFGGEIILAEAMLLIGVSIIYRLTR